MDWLLSIFNSAFQQPKEQLPGMLVATFATILAAAIIKSLKAIINRIKILVTIVMKKVGTNHRFKKLAIHQYLADVKKKFGVITNIYLDSREVLDLEKVFIPLQLQKSSIKRGSNYILSHPRDILTDCTQKRLLILGDPGAGKTTMMKALATGVASKQWIELRKEIPFFIPLRKFSQSSEKPNLHTWLSKQILPEHGLSNHEYLLESLLSKNKVLFLFDGLDEIADSKFDSTILSIEEFLSKWDKDRKCHMIFTCREQNYNLMSPYVFKNLGLEIYRLAEMRESEIDSLVFSRRKDFISNGKSPEKFLSRIKKQSISFRLHRNPLLLTMSIALYLRNSEDKVPARISDFYHECIDHLLQRRDLVDLGASKNRFSPNDKRTLLQRFAHGSITKASSKNLDFEDFHISELVQEAEHLAGEKLHIKKTDSKDVVEEIHKKAGIISMIGNSDYYTFAHRSFHEFLAACQLKVNGESGLSELKKNLLNPLWQQVIIFYASLDHSDSERLIVSLIALCSRSKGEKRITYLELLAKCTATLFHPQRKLKEQVCQVLEKAIRGARKRDKRRLLIGLFEILNTAQHEIESNVNSIVQKIIDKEDAQQLAIDITRMEDRTALPLLEYMLESGSLRLQKASLIGLENIQSVKKLDILWKYISIHRSDFKKGHIVQARFQILEILAKHEGAVDRLNDLYPYFRSSINSNFVKDVYPFDPDNEEPSNFAYILAYEKQCSQESNQPMESKLSRYYSFRSFFRSAISEKRPKELSDWKRLNLSKKPITVPINIRLITCALVTILMLFGFILEIWMIYQNPVLIFLLLGMQVMFCFFFGFFLLFSDKLEHLPNIQLANRSIEFAGIIEESQFLNNSRGGIFNKIVKWPFKIFLFIPLLFATIIAALPFSLLFLVSMFMTNPSFQGHSERVIDVISSDSTNKILTISMDQKAILWDVEKNTSQVIEEKAVYVNQSEKSELVVMGLENGNIKLLHNDTFQKVDFLKAHSYRIIDSEFDDIGKKLVSISIDKSAILWNLDTKKMISKLSIEDLEYYSTCLCGNDFWIVTRNYETIKIWNIASKELIYEVPIPIKQNVGYFGDIPIKFPNQNSLLNIDVSGNCKKLLISVDNGTIALWNLEQMKKEKSINASSSLIKAVFSDKSEQALLKLHSGAIDVWNLSENSINRRLTYVDFINTQEPIEKYYLDIIVTPNDSTITILEVKYKDKSKSNEIVLHDYDNKNTIASLAGYDEHIEHLRVTPDKKYFFAILDNQLVVLWNLESKNKLWISPRPFYNPETWKLKGFFIYIILLFISISVFIAAKDRWGEFNLPLKRVNKYYQLLNSESISMWIQNKS